jgi:hypothetical protein
MSVDTVHSLITVASLASIAIGAAVAWGPGYAAMILGALLLSAVIYARTR